MRVSNHEAALILRDVALRAPPQDEDGADLARANQEHSLAVRCIVNGALRGALQLYVQLTIHLPK